MTEAANTPAIAEGRPDAENEGRDESLMDVDRMVNEGLGGGRITIHNGLIDGAPADTDSLDDELH